MSTGLDKIRLKEVLYDRNRGERAIYCGLHGVTKEELDSLRNIYHYGRLHTLDIDPQYGPDLRINLDEEFYLPPSQYDLAILPYVLMYLKDPIRCLNNLLKYVPHVIIQESVVRDRPDQDPWPDLWRFCCDGMPSGLLTAEQQLLYSSPKWGRIDLSTLSVNTSWYYANGDGVSGIWTLGRS